MLPSDLKNSFILKNFNQFFAQIVLGKKRAQEGLLTSSTTDAGEQEKLLAFVGEISNSLATTLEEQESSISHEGGDFLNAYYQEGLYIMAALADETFLTLDWVGQGFWDMYLIEQKIFKTQISGDKFFTNLDAYLLNRDPLTIDLGSLYYFTLALGFRGKYRGINDNGAIKNYMHQLFVFVTRQEPSFEKKNYVLFPEAYGYMQYQGELLTLSNPRAWYAAFAALVFGMGILGSGLWYFQTSQLNAITNRILQHGK